MMMQERQPRMKMSEDVVGTSPEPQQERELSAPKQSLHPKLNNVNFNEQSKQRKAQSKVRPDYAKIDETEEKNA